MSHEEPVQDNDYRLKYSAIQRIVSSVVLMLIVMAFDFYFDLELPVFFASIFITGFILLNLMMLIFPIPGQQLLNNFTQALNLLLITYIIYLFGGIRANSLIIGYVLIIMYTSVFYSRLTAFYTTALSIILYLGLIILQYHGTLPEPPITLFTGIVTKEYFLFFGTLNTLILIQTVILSISILETMQKDHAHTSGASLELEENIRAQTGQLKRTQTHLDKLINSVREFAIISVGEDGTIVSFHEGSKGIFGWQASEIEGANIAVLRGSDQKESVQDLLERAQKMLSSGSSVDQMSEMGVQLIRKNGEEFTGDITVSLMVHGDETGFLFIIRDTSSQEGINRKLQKTQSRYKGFIDALKDSLVTINAEGAFTWANKYFLELSGYELEELLGSVKPGSVFVFSKEAEAKFQDMSSWAAEIFLVHKNGRHIPISLNMSTIKEENGESGAVGLIKDLTAVRENEQYIENYTRQLQESRTELEKVNNQLVEQQKELRQSKTELEKLNKVKNAFIANLSQELKTPLIAGLGYIDLILNGDAGVVNADVLNYMQISHRNFKKLGLMIDNLLSLSKLTERDQAAEFAPINLMERIPAWLKNDIREKSIEVAINIPRPVATVQGDDFLLSKVFGNLTYFSKTLQPDRGPSVTISAAARAGRVLEIQYHDRRLHLPPAQVEHLFDSFMETDIKDVSKSGVMGIGLSIVRNIIELHGGSIAVTSDPENGTIFKFNLQRNM